MRKPTMPRKAILSGVLFGILLWFVIIDGIIIFTGGF